MIKKYPFFKRLVLSFYSKELYAHIGRNEIGKPGIKYIFFMLCIFWIPEMVKMQVSLSRSINDELPVFVEKLPNITIKNGVASMDKASPYIIKDDKTGEDLMIFDMSGEYTSLEGTEAKLLLTDTRFIYEKDGVETREYSLRTINDFEVTHDLILGWAKLFNYLWIICYIFIIPFALMYRMLQVLIYSLAGLIFQTILGTRLSFQSIYRLCAVAITPAFILDKLLGYFDIDFSGFSFLCFAISLGYLYFAMSANKPTEEELFPPPPPEFRTDDGSGNSGIQ